jgi:hypothetical protein
MLLIRCDPNVPRAVLDRVWPPLERAARRCGTWCDPRWEPLIAPTLADEATRKPYD